ncbi:50S ribosomal protein L30e [archaeon]|nr:50S ribosomal protein L30e [archaeon]
MDVIQAVRKAAKSGKVSYGIRSAKSNLINGKALAIIVADNCPRTYCSDVSGLAELAGIPLIKFGGSGAELGELCGKPFPVTALSVMDAASVTELTRGKK